MDPEQGFSRWLRVLLSIVFSVAGAVAAYHLVEPLSWFAVVGAAVLGALVGWWVGRGAFNAMISPF